MNSWSCLSEEEKASFKSHGKLTVKNKTAYGSFSVSFTHKNFSVKDELSAKKNGPLGPFNIYI